MCSPGEVGKRFYKFCQIGDLRDYVITRHGKEAERIEGCTQSNRPFPYTKKIKTLTAPGLLEYAGSLRGKDLKDFRHKTDRSSGVQKSIASLTPTPHSSPHGSLVDRRRAGGDHPSVARIYKPAEVRVAVGALPIQA